MRELVLLLLLPAVHAESPRISSWIRAQPAASGAILHVAPEVHSVRLDGGAVVVKSAGLSAISFGALQFRPAEETGAIRSYSFRIPAVPQRADGASPLPPGPVGVFVTGVPIYSPGAGLTYKGAGLWHADSVARNAAQKSPLLDSLLSDSSRHSPLIGFALDGYPIYGPFGWDESRNVVRRRSSYRLRAGDGRRYLGPLELTPAQQGPPIGPEFPRGTFVEDYEYCPGSGDLDEHNGRFAITPEFPEGTYAYFLSTSDRGEPAYPYLIGPSFYGTTAAPIPGGLRRYAVSHGLELLKAGEMFLFRTQLPLERVHEKDLHVIVVSEDLSSFEHVHPAAMGGGAYLLTFRFPHPGRFTIFADHTPAGKPQTISRFEWTEPGEPPVARRLQANPGAAKTVSGVTAYLSALDPLETGRDIRFSFRLDTTDLQPYLGAWGHILIASEDRSEFIHSHPIESATPAGVWSHDHTVEVPPQVIDSLAGFRRPGLYKVWLQVQRKGEVLTFPWVIDVKQGMSRSPLTPGPGDAIEIRIGAAGYEPPRIEIPEGKSVRLAFHRMDAQNCGSKVVIPKLGITRDLPPGEVVIIDLPPQSKGELSFGCGMGMYKGSIVVK